jgi:hypothetical protein
MPVADIGAKPPFEPDAHMREQSAIVPAPGVDRVTACSDRATQ